MSAPLDKDMRPVAVGDDICLDGVWHPIAAIEPGLKVFGKDGPKVLAVAVIANGSSWNVANHQTRPHAREGVEK